MELSIIFVNWNSTDYLRESIASVYENTRGIPFEIIVVDNASPADDVEKLIPRFPDVKVIKSPHNLGFAGANNLGFTLSSGTHLLFLNPDTKLVGPAITTMLEKLESLPDAAIVGCRLLNNDLSLQTTCIQTFPTILNQVLDTDFFRKRWPNCSLWGIAPLWSKSSAPARIEAVCGACLMIKRRAFADVGMFSEDYFMYAEDLDLCYRTARAGYANYYIGNAAVIHYGGKSSSPEPATVLKWQSLLRYFANNHGRFRAAMFRIVMAFVAAGRLAAMAVLSVFGHELGANYDGYPSSAKWRTILKTLLSRSGSSKPRRTVEGIRPVGGEKNSGACGD